MTVPATDRRAGPFPGTGSITALPFTFKVFEAADVVVTKTNTSGVESTLALTTDYTVSVNADQDSSPGGTVTPVVAPASGESITLTSGLSYEQTLDLLTGGNFSPRAIEDAFDRTVIQIQQLAEQLGRTLQAPVSFDGDAALPNPVAGNVIGWDDTATGLRNIDPTTLASIVAYANRRTLVGNGGDASYTLAADPGNVSNTLVAVSGVVQTPGVDYTVSGVTLTPTTVWPSGTGNVVIVYGEALPVGTQDASVVTFTEAGGGAVSRTLQVKLREGYVSPISYGAVGNGVADDTTAFSLCAAAGKPIVLPLGYNFVISSPVTISTNMEGQGMDTNQSTITLTGTGQLNMGDENCDWGGFTVQSAVNSRVFINVEHSYCRSTKGLRFEKLSGATGQVGLRFNTTSRSVYQCAFPLLKTNVDYPVFITGNNTQVFNNNFVGGPSSYFQNFASAITSENQLATDGNTFEGYFETGTNFLSHNAGALRQNRFRYLLDAVTRDLSVTPTVADPNLWERLDGGSFTVSGTMPVNQVFIGIPFTRVRATQATAQAINNATATAMQADTEVYDTLSEFTPGSGLFTAKHAGLYRVRGAAMSASVAWDAGERWEVAVYKNGAEYARGIPSVADAATTRQRMSSVDTIVSLVVNDTVDMRVLHNQGAAVNLNNSGLTNYIEIERVQ